MLLYWPCDQGINLNNEVANLFFVTKQKFTKNLSNQTDYSLYIDILDNSCRSQLFFSVLEELEILILDIVELDLNTNNIQSLAPKILLDLVQKSMKNFLSPSNNYKFIYLKEKAKVNIALKLLDYQLVLEYLLIYLVFGSSYVSSKTFVFDNLKTPKKHVAVLLEHLIIQVSNLVVLGILENMNSLVEINCFIQNNFLCSQAYISIRSLAFFRNNQIIQNIVYFYIQKPKEIYSSRCKVWLISSNGLVTKYISMNRLYDLSQLSKTQLVIIFLIEMQDLIVPKLESLLLLLSKTVIYIFINFLGNSIILVLRVILSKIYRVNK